MKANDVQSTEERGLSLAGKRLLAILAYYVCAAIVLALTRRFAPAPMQELAEQSIAHLVAGASGVITKSQVAAGATEGAAPSAWLQGMSTLLALGGALAAAMPVALVYSLTRRRKGFEQSMVHILLLLPIAVAGMVVLIQNNLALAFSLAGIVAVLRFRNSLEDVKDGVYVFIAVSIGMSAGVGALAIGLVTSTVFNICVLLLWWLDFARRPASGLRGGWRDLARLPNVLPQKAASDEQAPSDQESGEAVFADAARAWRRQLQITAEHHAASPEKAFNATLRIHSTAPEITRPAVEAILQTQTKRWELTGIVPEAGAFALKYRARVRREERADLLDALRTATNAIGVELR